MCHEQSTRRHQHMQQHSLEQCCRQPAHRPALLLHGQSTGLYCDLDLGIDSASIISSFSSFWFRLFFLERSWTARPASPAWPPCLGVVSSAVPAPAPAPAPVLSRAAQNPYRPPAEAAAGRTLRVLLDRRPVRNRLCVVCSTTFAAKTVPFPAVLRASPNNALEQQIVIPSWCDAATAGCAEGMDDFVEQSERAADKTKAAC